MDNRINAMYCANHIYYAYSLPFQLLEELNTAKQDTTHVTKDMQSSTEAQQSAKALCC